MSESTHRKLLFRYLGTIAVTSAALALLGLLLVPFTSREFALYVASAGALVACFGMMPGHGRACATARLAEGSRPGIELKLLPLLAAAPVVYAVVRIASERPRPGFVTIALAIAAAALFVAVLSGCRAITRAGSAAKPS